MRWGPSGARTRVRTVRIDGGGYRPEPAVDKPAVLRMSPVLRWLVRAAFSLVRFSQPTQRISFRTSSAPAKEGSQMFLYVVKAVEASVSIGGARNPGRESGRPKVLVAIVRPGEVAR